MDNNMTLSEKRRAACMVGVKTRQEKARNDPVVNIGVRASDKARLQAFAEAEGITLTEAFHRKV